MKQLIIAFLLFAAATDCRAYDIVYSKSDSIKVEMLLAKAAKKNKATNFILFFARELKGLPYVAHTLEVNKTEKLVVNLRQLDCTTYVENVFALYLCMKQEKLSFKDFCNNLYTMRYRGGAGVHYASRLHYFTDWIADNQSKGLCEEVQAPVPPFSAVQKINVYYMSAHPEKYKMLKENPKDVSKIAASEKKINGRTYRYIPKSAVRNTRLLRETVHDGDIIALTTTLKGLDIQHIGFAVWHADSLHLLNASSLRHKVVEEPQLLYNYLLKQKTMTGMRIIRIL